MPLTRRARSACRSACCATSSARFIAYFHTGQIDDLIALTEYALKVTPNSEEALLWHGWAMYRQGDTPQAVENFQQALVENPNYIDAQYALDFVRGN